MAKCELCNLEFPTLQTHHVFNSYNKKNSERYGCLKKICFKCHREIHDNYEKELELKQKEQQRLENEGMTREQFIKIFHRSYLWKLI